MTYGKTPRWDALNKIIFLIFKTVKSASLLDVYSSINYPNFYPILLNHVLKCKNDGF